MLDLMRKVEQATILGTVQSTLTHFPYLRKIWKTNTEQERLLGVSITGIMDCELLNGRIPGLEDRLEKLKAVAVQTNQKYAELLGIPVSTAITCVELLSALSV